MRQSLRAVAFATTAAVAFAAPLTAQSPSDVLVRVTDSLVAFDAPDRALALLDSAVQATRPQDARLWHRYGLVAWQVARPQRSGGFIRDGRIIKLLEGADSALNLATQLAPDSGRFALDLARFYLDSEFAPTRGAAVRFTDRALDAARRTGDTRLLAEAALEHGRVYWRRYEGSGRRAFTREGAAMQPGFSTQAGWTRDKAKDFVESFVIAVPMDEEGTSDFRKARALFEEALAADPDNVRARRHVHMALAELELWPELRDIARARAQASPFDATAWFALGLAHQRLGRPDSASAAFDTAMERISEGEKRRLTSLARILRTRTAKDAAGIGDTAALAKLPPGQRETYERLYWLMADPLAVTDENENETEFLARVAYAEMRFTDDDAGITGSDTDRGDIHVRYGPPARVFNTIGNTTDYRLAGSTVTWVYENGLVFIFDLASGFGRARISIDDRFAVEQIREAVPVSFDNVEAARAVDTVPVRYARFRSGGDSLDVLVAARIPFPRLVRDVELDRTRVLLGFRVLDGAAQVRADDKREETVAVEGIAARDVRYDARIGRGFNLLRVEAFQPELRNAARALVRLEPAATSGFGVSDVLLSRTAEPRAGVAVPRGWRDLDIAPALGVFRAGEPIGLVWETYELGRTGEGGNSYRVSIAVEKTSRGGVLGLAGRVLDNAGQALGRSRRTRNGVTISFDREVPAAPVQVEFFTVDLTGSTPGDYTLTVTVEDRTGKRTAETRTTFTIVE